MEIKKPIKFLKERGVVILITIIGTVAGICTILGISFWSVINEYTDVKAKQLRIGDLENTTTKLTKLLDESQSENKFLKNEIVSLKSLPNQDKKRTDFLEQAHIEIKNGKIYDTKRKVTYCDNCFQSNPMKIIPLQPFNTWDEKCPSCGAHYTFILSK